MKRIDESHSISPAIGIALKAEKQSAATEKGIILKEMYYRTLSNKLNEKHFIDGRYWVYYSASALAKKFPYMVSSSISRWMNQLAENNWFLVGNYNEKGYDQTKWYALNTDKYDAAILNVMKTEIPISQNDKCISQNERPIPTTLTTLTTNTIKEDNSIQKETPFNPLEVEVKLKEHFSDENQKEMLFHLILRKFSDDDLDSIIESFAITGVPKYYRNVKTFDEMLGKFRKWAKRSKVQYSPKTKSADSYSINGITYAIKEFAENEKSGFVRKIAEGLTADVVLKRMDKALSLIASIDYYKTLEPLTDSELVRYAMKYGGSESYFLRIITDAQKYAPGHRRLFSLFEKQTEYTKK